MYQNNIFFIFKKLFLISVHQNDLKILKKLIFFKNIFETQKQTELYETRLKKHVKTIIPCIIEVITLSLS
jgi:hypothetical protein